MVNELIKGPIGAFSVAVQVGGTLPRSANKREDASIICTACACLALSDWVNTSPAGSALISAQLA